MNGVWSILAACAAPEGGEIVTDTPRIQLVDPEDGADRYGSSVTATFQVDGLELDEEGMGLPDEAGHGHVHAYLDGALYGETAETTFTFEDVPPGEHRLELALATNRHDEPWGRARAELRLADASLTVVAPADGAVVDAALVPVDLDVTGFALDADTAFGDPVFGQGRYELFVDGEMAAFGVDPEAYVSVPPGKHVVTARLVTADGVALNAPVEDSVDVEVADGTPYVHVERGAFVGPYGSATLPLVITAQNAALAYRVSLDGVIVGKGDTSAFVVEHVPGGRHRVEVELMRGSQALGIRDVLDAWVEAGRPDVTFVHPLADWRVPAQTDVTVAVEGLQLDPALGSADVPGHGHLAFSVDGEPLTESADLVTSLTLPTGDHWLTAELVENDGGHLDPPVWSTIALQVR